MSAIQYCGCPKCDAVFKLPEGGPSVETARCGVCRVVFDVATNIKEKTDDDFETKLNHGNGNNNESTIQGIYIDEEVNPFEYRVPRSLHVHGEFEFIDDGVLAEPLYTSASLSENALPEPDQNGVEHKVAHYIRDRANPLATFIWFIAVIGFVFLLGMQVKHFLVPQYAQDTTYRQYLIGFCKIVDCQLAPLQNPFQFALTHTRIDLHPSEPGALRVAVKAVNQAEFAQPYPHVQLTLTDRVGRVVGRRTFSPNLYLPKGMVNMVAQGQLAPIVLDLARPHEEAIGFIVDIVSEPASS